MKLLFILLSWYLLNKLLSRLADYEHITHLQMRSWLKCLHTPLLTLTRGTSSARVTQHLFKMVHLVKLLEVFTIILRKKI